MNMSGPHGSVAVTLSTSSVYPHGPAQAFDIADRLGYDGIEVMVLSDPTTQDAVALRELVDRHGLPVRSIHAPTLLVTQRVYGNSPWDKIDRSIELAHELGATTIVMHPPFRWQRDYAASFVEGVAARERSSGLCLAVENMYPWRAGTEWQVYVPGWNPVPQSYEHVTLDLSHAATARCDVLAMQAELGTRLSHVHLADGSGSLKDEHLAPGRGKQPCAEFLRRLGPAGFHGDVVVEVGTRRLAPDAREADLRECLEFARRHLESGDGPGSGGPEGGSAG